MNTEALIREIAQTWHEGGGDAMGFSWCQDRIRAAILELDSPPPQERRAHRGISRGGRYCTDNDCKCHDPTYARDFEASSQVQHNSAHPQE